MEKEKNQELGDEILENVTGGVGIIVEEWLPSGESYGTGNGLPEGKKKKYAAIEFAAPETGAESLDEDNVWPPW